MSNLQGKRVLFITPFFNSYELKIKKAMEKKGAIVEMYSERVTPSLMSRIFPSVNTANCQVEYLSSILDKVKLNYDFLFVIKSEYLTSDFYTSLLAKVSFNKKIVYQWDSIANNENFSVVKKYFDDIFTFDRSDSVKYGYVYKPLFYHDAFSKKQDLNKSYDLFFVGVYYKDRFELLKKIDHVAKENGLKCYFKLYISLNNYISSFFYNGDIRKVPLDMVIFKGMSNIDVANVLHASSVVVDVCNSRQSGLTIRTFEALGAGKKLLTNNKEVKKEDFYDEHNIMIIEDLDRLVDFCNAENKNLDFSEYHVDNWVDEFFKN